MIELNSNTAKDRYVIDFTFEICRAIILFIFSVGSYSGIPFFLCPWLFQGN